MSYDRQEKPQSKRIMQVNRVSLDLQASNPLDRSDLFGVGTKGSNSTRGADVPY